MTIFRGPGGTGSATSDSDTTEFQEFLVQSQAARDAALAAQVAAELAETNAETAETNAETAETNAETAATNAASSASAAASSASSASTSATNAASSASAASTSATNASASASAAAASARAALTSENNAETAETNAAASASAAASSASTATTQASNAAASASAALASETAAALSASSASSSASAASISASNAATSASNAASSATSAANSASAAAASAASINPADIVHISGAETITGAKTFSQTITGSITGNAANVTNTVAIANGGTGQTTRQNAINALAGAVTSGQYLRGNGTDVVMSAIQVADVPTLNQNTTGTASNVTGTVAVANGGTGVTTSTGSGSVVLSSSPTLTTPNINSAQFATVTGTAPLYACRAWVNFNGTGTVAIRASGNVSSITDNGTGYYTVNFTNAMPDANYSVNANNSPNFAGAFSAGVALFSNDTVTEIAPTTSAATITFVNTAGSAYDPKYACISIFR